MCDPVSLMVAGTVISSVGTSAGGVMQAQTAKANAAALEQQARLREEQGKYEAEQARRNYMRTRGKVIAGAAASGGSLGTFSDILADDAAEAAVEREAIRFGATVDANNLRSRASAVRAEGRAAMVGSVFSAAGNAAAGFGRSKAMAA